MAETCWDVALGATTIQNVRAVSYNDSANVIADRASGASAPSAQFLGNVEPIATIQSSDIGNLVSLNTSTFASNGICITGTTTVLPLAKRADCAVVATGAVHSSISCNNTVVIPTSFEVRQESTEGAMANLECRFRSSDGLTSPTTISTTYSLPATTFGATFGLGKAFINSVEVSQLVGLMVNPNITLNVQRVGGGIYPITHFLIQTEPTIDIMVEDIQAALGYVPTAGSSVPVEVYFRRRLDGAVFEPDASLLHVRFAFTGALVRTDSLEASQQGNGSATIRCHGKLLTATNLVAIP